MLQAVRPLARSLPHSAHRTLKGRPRMPTPGAVKEYALVIGLNLAMTVAKTWMHGKAYANEGFSQEDQRLLFTQEWIRQTVSTVLWLASLGGSYVLTKRLFPRQSQMARVFTTNLLSSVPDTFVRPFLTAKITRHLLPPEDSKTEAQAIPQPVALPKVVIRHAAVAPQPRPTTVIPTTYLPPTWPYPAYYADRPVHIAPSAVMPGAWGGF